MTQLEKVAVEFNKLNGLNIDRPNRLSGIPGTELETDAECARQLDVSLGICQCIWNKLNVDMKDY